MARVDPLSANQTPDLSLADYPMPDVASGSSRTYMPAPARVIPQDPPMNTSDPYGDIYRMGIDPAQPYYDLELACGQMEPASPPDANQLNAPTFITPDFSIPGARPYDLAMPGIDHVPEFAPDPHTGDLLQFSRPGGLDIHAATLNPLEPDPMAPDLSEYDRPGNLTMPGSMMVDPALPDLQQPRLVPDVRMRPEDRPGSMAPEASLNLGPDNDGDDDIAGPAYRKNFTTPGMTRRERHLNPLYQGLRGDLDE
jgi:hypothetical protein